MTPTFKIESNLRLCAAALAGDTEALQTLANSPEHEELVASNRLAPALAIRATDLGVDGPQLGTWMRHMRHNAVMRMRLEAARHHLSETLAATGISWAPLKGLGLDPRIHPRPEERISTDLDVLVSPIHAEPAVEALVSHGWRSTETTDRRRSYTLDEGYNWHLASSDGLLLELHFRLWGGVTEKLAADIFKRAQPAPEFGPTARRFDLADTYLVAAVHVWQTPPPRYLFLWWDLHRMASILDDSDVKGVIARAEDQGLHAYVASSAGTAADLWKNPTNRKIANELENGLRPPERWAAATMRSSSPGTASLGALTLGRLLANRPSRSGWRAVIRQIWAHPGTVEAATPEEWSWPRRRLTHLARKLHLTK